MNNSNKYNIIKKATQDIAYLHFLASNPHDVLEDEGITDYFEREELINIMNPLYVSITQSAEVQSLFMNQIITTNKTADKFKEGLRKTIEQIESGYKSIMLMYKVAFYLGIALIIAALIVGIVGGESLLAIAFGGLGVADVITYFITKPPQDLQNSRANLAQLQAAYFNWFSDVINWNTYLGKLDQAGFITMENVKDISDIKLTNTDKTMELIEKYCHY